VTQLQAGQLAAEHRVRAHNAATQSENKIHDDTVARQFGFAGGLVPGVTVFAYMTRPVVDALGPEWLERGRMDGRFVKPFYEGEQVTVRATVREQGEFGPILDLAAVGDDGETRATGSASLLAPDAAARVDIATVPAADRLPERPPASEEWFRAHEHMGSIGEQWDATKAEGFLDQIGDDLPLWRGAGAVAHPGYLIRFANSVLVANVVLGPWIHVSSDAEYLGLVREGDELSTRARVTDVFERKGHKFVELDVLTVSGDRPIMRVRHTAIYEPRQVAPGR